VLGNTKSFFQLALALALTMIMIIALIVIITFTILTTVLGHVQMSTTTTAFWRS